MGSDPPEKGSDQLTPDRLYQRKVMALEDQLQAGKNIVECLRVLQKTGGNVVGDILKQSPGFKQWQHCPKGDVFDQETHSQYYYHAHPPVARKVPAEHGHFHCFLRKAGMPAHCKAIKAPVHSQEKTADLSHLIAISMDHYGFPIGLLTTNRWVTGEAWYKADDVIDMLDHFNIDHAWPSWPSNLWLTNMIRLFKPQIITLIKERDAKIQAWQDKHPDVDVFEDRRLEITSYLAISIEEEIQRLNAMCLATLNP